MCAVCCCRVCCSSLDVLSYHRHKTVAEAFLLGWLLCHVRVCLCFAELATCQRQLQLHAAMGPKLGGVVCSACHTAIVYSVGASSCGSGVTKVAECCGVLLVELLCPSHHSGLLCVCAWPRREPADTAGLALSCGLVPTTCRLLLIWTTRICLCVACSSASGCQWWWQKEGGKGGALEY